MSIGLLEHVNLILQVALLGKVVRSLFFPLVQYGELILHLQIRIQAGLGKPVIWPGKVKIASEHFH